MKRFLSLAIPAAAIAAFVAYAVAAHLVFASAQGTRLAALFAWAPLGLTALWTLWNSAYRRAAAVALAAVTAALWVFWPDHDSNIRGANIHGVDITVIYLGQYVALQVALGVLFGRTLLSEREPLVTRFAHLVHGELPPPIARYTRAVTVAWVLFFVGMASIAILLYAFASRTAWSAFVNLLTLPCIAAMFLVEYGVRRLLFPWFGHASIFAGMRAFWRAFYRAQP